MSTHPHLRLEIERGFFRMSEDEEANAAKWHTAFKDIYVGIDLGPKTYVSNCGCLVALMRDERGGTNKQ